MRLFILVFFLLLLSSCDNATEGGASQVGEIQGYITPYSDCSELADKSGFKVELVRLQRSTLTDAQGFFEFSTIPAFFGDTVIISKDGYWTQWRLAMVEPNQPLDLHGIYLNRIAPYVVKFTSGWRMDSSTIGLNFDSTFFNANGDLVKTQVRRIVRDTLMGIDYEILHNGQPAPASVRLRLPAYKTSRWENPQGLDIPGLSLQAMRWRGLKSGDLVTVYASAEDNCGGFTTGAVRRGPVSDSATFVIP